jgi:hypothetical protein
MQWHPIGQCHIISSRVVTCMLTIYILGETLPPRVCMRALPRHQCSRRTRTARIACGAALTLLLQLLTSSQLESNSNSWSNLLLLVFAPMSSGAVHRPGAMPAWAALPAATAAESQRFSTTTNWLPLTTRAASTAKSPCAGSSPSPFSWTPLPSSLAAERPEEAELLARGAPNPHQLAAQVT